MRRRQSCSLVLLFSIIFATTLASGATVPGKNGRIAFGRFDPRIGDFDLYTANPDGSKVAQLTLVPSFISDWSPNGDRIAFDFFDEDGNEQVAVINPDGSGIEPITSGTGIHEVPSWSPDGTQIAFDYSPLLPDEPTFHTLIYVMNSDGSNPHAVTRNPNVFDVEPHFSPDGQHILFTRILPGTDSVLQQNALFVMNADGSDERQLTLWRLFAEHGNWSPDGRWIVFNTDQPRGFGAIIFLVHPDGSDMHVILRGTAGSRIREPIGGHKPTFSPDGTKIIFTCSFSNHEFFWDDICTMDPDGTHIRHVTLSPETPDNFPSWGVATDRVF